MKKFFRRIVSFLGTLFVNLDEWIHEHIQPSIDTVERIKNMVDSPVANLLTALIPGDLDNKLQSAIVKHLGNAIDKMHITNEILLEPDWTNKVAKMLEYLKTLSNPMRSAIYKKLAAEIAKQSYNGNETVKGHSIDLLVQLQYSKMKESVNWDDLDEVDRFAVEKQADAQNQIVDTGLGGSGELQ